jgi:hypothetical protein
MLPPQSEATKKKTKTSKQKGKKWKSIKNS